MKKVPLTAESEFLVKEEKVLSFILAGLCFAIFLFGLGDMILRHFKNDYADYLYMLALLPAFFFLRKGKSHRIYIRINKTGIFQDEKLVTSWPNYLNAYIAQDKGKTMLPTIQDNFVLIVEYKKADDGKGFRTKIKLANTQNKSEEEVLEAVKFFRALNR
jgi:hypothetical protein